MEVSSSRNGDLSRCGSTGCNLQDRRLRLLVVRASGDEYSNVSLGVYLSMGDA